MRSRPARWCGRVGTWAIAAASCGLGVGGAARAGANDFTVQDLAPGVHAFVRTAPPGLLVDGNVLVIINADDVVVVDSNYTPASAEASIAALRKLTTKPVRYLVNTHRHVDHTAGNQVYQREFPGIEIVGHPAMLEDLTAKGEETVRGWIHGSTDLDGQLQTWLKDGKNLAGEPLSDAERRSYESDLRLARHMVANGPAIQVTAPTLLIDDRLVLHRGARQIEIRHLGKSHTRGDLVVYLPAEGIVATGDLVVAPVPLVGSDQSYVGEWAETLNRLLALGATTYLPGHGPVLKGDPATTHITTYRDFLSSVDRQARAAIARGESEEKARQSVDVLEFRDRMAGEERLLQILFGIYGKAPAIGAVYREVATPATPSSAR
jgi:cyclase